MSVRVMLTLNDDLLARVDKACKEQGIKRSAYFSALAYRDLGESEKYLEEFNRMIKEALENMKTGVHESM